MYDVSIFHSSCFHTVHVLILLHDARYFLPVVPVCFVMKLSWGGACSRTASATNAQTGTKMVLRMRKPCWQWEWSNTAWKKKKMLNKSYNCKHYRCTKDCANLGNVLHEVSRLSYTWSRKKYIYCHVQQKAVHLQYIYAKSSAEVHHRLEGSSHHSPSPLYFLFFYGKHAYYAMLTSTTWSLANLSMTNASIKPRSQSYFSKISLISMAHILSSTWGIFNVTHWKKNIKQEIACTASILMTFHNRWHVSSELSYIVWCGPLFST